MRRRSRSALADRQRSQGLLIPEARLLVADTDGHQSLPVSNCAYEIDARFLADPNSVSSVTLCGK